METNLHHLSRMRLLSIHTLLYITLFIIPIQCKDSETVTSEPEPDLPLRAPELLKPENQSEQPTSLTLSWQKVGQADSYHVQLSVFATFDSLLADEKTDSTHLYIEDLPTGTTIHWRTRSINGNLQSNWSAVSLFMTENAEPEPDPDPDPTDPGETELRIMPLGNSITEAVGYRLPLWHLLTNAGFEVEYVGSQSSPHPNLPDDDHEGHGGWYISHIAQNVNDWLARYQPNFILLMIGTNDVAWWSARSGEQIAEAHNKLVGQILDNSSSDTWVLVASIPPQSSKTIEPNNVDRAQLARNLNAEMERHMKQRIDNGENVYFVDMHSQLTTGHLTDGIHPNQEGYKIITDTWDRALMQVLSQVQQNQ